MRLPSGQLLGYCTNVHPYATLAGLLDVLRDETAPLRERLVAEGRLARDAPLGVGLWLPAVVADAVARDPDPLRHALDAHRLLAFTANAFPHGDFHGGSVKEAVFRPHWAEPERLRYTLAAARALAALLPPGETGSISTHSGSYKAWGVDEAAIASGFRAAAEGLQRLEDDTGRRVLLALEPEPLSLLETTEEVASFFTRHALLTEHLGVCFDACHQAVEFEDMAAAVGRLAAARIPIAKAQLSVALRVPDAARDAQALRPYAEDRWFHQVVERDRGLRRIADLPEALAGEKRGEWRVHFHVPLFAERLDEEGRLLTTRPSLAELLPLLGVTPHLEIETYSFALIPEERRRALGAVGLQDCLLREFAWVLDSLEARR